MGRAMTDENLKLLLQAYFTEMLESSNNPTGTVAMLISETVKFRDQLKSETGEVLTVADTRVALDALEVYLESNSLPKKLTSEQTALTQIWIDRLTLFSG